MLDYTKMVKTNISCNILRIKEVAEGNLGVVKRSLLSAVAATLYFVDVFKAQMSLDSCFTSVMKASPFKRFHGNDIFVLYMCN